MNPFATKESHVPSIPEDTSPDNVRDGLHRFLADRAAARGVSLLTREDERQREIARLRAGLRRAAA